MQVLLALTSCCSGIGCGSAQKHMETVNKMGQRPFVIAFRSYSGSRVALHNAANDLLTASGVIAYAAGGSDYEWYHDKDRKNDFIASATLFKSDLPVEAILGMMSAVEERLGGPQREPAPLMKLDLLWVEGVEMETPEVTLPSPLIFEKFWANSIFVEAAEVALFASKEEGHEKASFVRRVASAFKHFEGMDDPAVRYFFTTNRWGESDLTLERKPGGTVYDHGATDDVDTLAIAGDLLLSAEQDVLRGRDPKTPWDESDEDAYGRIGDVMEKLSRDVVLPLQVAVVANASVDAKAQDWVDGIARLLAAEHFVGKRTIIYSDGPTQISGAVLGHPAPKFKPFFQPGDTAVSSLRLADLPINRYAQEQARDNRLVKLATMYYQRPLPAPK
jgi:hypothetical protein